MDPTITTTPTRSSAVDSDAWVPPPPPPNPHDEPPLQLPPVPGGGKLRLMCSYGGHIVPRPHDKSLCYVGGDTRIVVVDRSSSLSSLCNRLSDTLLQSSSQRRSFSLKYQLPTEDLDSLISLTTDEDLDNMIEEYDRTAAATKPSRLRLFLFLSKPETSASMGALLDDAKSETWFVDALNGSGLLPRGLSDSAAEDCLLLGLRDGEAQGDFNKQVATAVVVENSSSSFGSSSSSPSMSNLPPIRVRVAADEEPKPTVPGAATIEEQFAQITYVSTTTSSAVTAASDDEKSDHGGGGGGASAPVGFRKPPLPLQPVQQKGGSGGSGGGGNGGGYGLPSPDSVASDTSSSSLSKPAYYQDQQQQYAPPPQPRVDASEPVPSGTHIVQQAKDTGGSYIVQPHLDQYHHYVPAQISPYYQIYPQNPQQQFHHPIDHQYPPPSPLYVVPTATGSRPQAPTSSGIPPVYPTKPPATTHYVGYSHHPSQSVSGAHNYAFEYSNTVPAEHHHVYYAAPPSQYQSMTPAAAYALSEAAKQLPSDNNNAHPQSATSQPQ